MMRELDNLFDGPALSPDQAIREYIRQDKVIKDAAYERNAAAAIIRDEAQRSKDGNLKTVHVETADGKQRLKVEFKSELQVQDPDNQMDTVRELLGEKRFAEVFKVEYTPRSRALQSFLNTSSGDEAFRTAKEIVKEIVKEVPKTPSVTVERS
jgi:hypothetical protein